MSFKFRCKNSQCVMDLASEPFVLFPDKKNKTKQNTLINLHRRASLHVRTTVETLETICIVYLVTVINKDMYQSARLSFYYKQAPPPPHNNIEFPSKTGSDPLNKITKLLSQPSMLGHHRHASETPYIIWRIACGPMMARL